MLSDTSASVDDDENTDNFYKKYTGNDMIYYKIKFNAEIENILQSPFLPLQIKKKYLNNIDLETHKILLYLIDAIGEMNVFLNLTSSLLVASFEKSEHLNKKFKHVLFNLSKFLKKYATTNRFFRYVVDNAILTKGKFNTFLHNPKTPLVVMMTFDFLKEYCDMMNEEFLSKIENSATVEELLKFEIPDLPESDLLEYYKEKNAENFDEKNDDDDENDDSNYDIKENSNNSSGVENEELIKDKDSNTNDEMYKTILKNDSFKSELKLKTISSSSYDTTTNDVKEINENSIEEILDESKKDLYDEMYNDDEIDNDSFSESESKITTYYTPNTVETKDDSLVDVKKITESVKQDFSENNDENFVYKRREDLHKQNDQTILNINLINKILDEESVKHETFLNDKKSYDSSFIDFKKSISEKNIDTEVDVEIQKKNYRETKRNKEYLSENVMSESFNLFN